MKSNEEEQNKKNNDKNSNLINIITISIVILLVALVAFFLIRDEIKRNSDENKIAYTDLVKEINNGNVE